MRVDRHRRTRLQVTGGGKRTAFAVFAKTQGFDTEQRRKGERVVHRRHIQVLYGQSRACVSGGDRRLQRQGAELPRNLVDVLVSRLAAATQNVDRGLFQTPLSGVATGGQHDGATAIGDQGAVPTAKRRGGGRGVQVFLHR